MGLCAIQRTQRVLGLVKRHPGEVPSRGRPRRRLTSFPRNRHRSHLRPHRHAGLAEGGTGTIIKPLDSVWIFLRKALKLNKKDPE